MFLWSRLLPYERYALAILSRCDAPKYSDEAENCNHNGQHYGTADDLQMGKVSMNGVHRLSLSSCTAMAEDTWAKFGLILVRT